MQKKIIIIGSRGMAGHVLFHYFKSLDQYNVIDIARTSSDYKPTYSCDVTDVKKVQEIIESEKPEVVVNCIGVLNKDAENHPEKAIFLNSYFPHFLAQMGNEQKFKLVHISTDCVFSGKKGNYKETDVKDGIGFYAQSKALGEVSYGDHLTIRTSIIGPELKDNGIGLFHWFMKQHGEIKGYTKAIWTGVTTFQLAKAVEAAIEQDVFGLIHLVNGEKINKYDLLMLLKKVFEKAEVSIVPFEGYEVDKSLIRTNESLFYQVPSYEQMVSEMAKVVKKMSHLYSHYSIPE